MASVRGDERPRPTDADTFRHAWDELERLWPPTVLRAAALPPALLHERVHGEWSFIETLRHLLFVSDAWGSRALLGTAAPYQPLALPPTGMRNPALPPVLDVTPSLDEMLPLRAQRLDVVRTVLAGLTDDALEETVRVRGPGYPRPGVYAVRRCALTLVNEEWQHRVYAERDLAVLEQGISR
jgi:hypothetical protein